MPSLLGVRVDIPSPFKYSAGQESAEKKKSCFSIDYDEAARICQVSLSLLKLHKPLSGVIELGLLGHTILKDLQSAIHSLRPNTLQQLLKESGLKPQAATTPDKPPLITQKHLKRLGKLSLSIGFLALAIVNARVANLAQTTLAVGKNGYDAYSAARNKDAKKSLESLAKCIGSGLYLGVQVYGGTELTVAALLVRVGLNFYDAHADYVKHQGVVRLEAIAKIALGCAYARQLAPHAEKLSAKYTPVLKPRVDALVNLLLHKGE